MLHHFLWRPAICSHHIDVVLRAGESHLVSVGRNGGALYFHWRVSKLRTLRSIGVTAPQIMVRVRSVSHPFPIFGKRRIDRGNSAEERQELLRLQIIVNKFATPLRADRKNLLSIRAQPRAGIFERSGSES